MRNSSSEVLIRKSNELVGVEVLSDMYLVVDDLVEDKWKSLVNISAKLLGVRSVVVTRLCPRHVEVFLTNEHQNSFFKIGEIFKLKQGSFCETVIGTRQELLIADAKTDKIWSEFVLSKSPEMVSYLGYPLLWPGGEVFGTVCFFDDKQNRFEDFEKSYLDVIKKTIETDLELLALKYNLEQSNEKLEKSNKVKSVFLSLISHDVRGSIGTIYEFLQLLLSNEDDLKNEEMIEALNVIKTSIGGAYATLDDLLLWSKSEMLELKASKSEVDVVALVEKVINFFNLQKTIKGQEITFEAKLGNNKRLLDALMFEASLRNLISNALKYTDVCGSISIRLFEKNKKTILEIQDSGVGMTQSQLDSLFSYFDGKSKSGTDGESSAGIGLILSKDLLDKNGIEIKVSSEKGKGSIFRLEF